MSTGFTGRDPGGDLTLRLRAMWHSQNSRRRVQVPGTLLRRRTDPKPVADGRDPLAYKAGVTAAQIVFGNHCLGPVGKADVAAAMQLLGPRRDSAIAIVGGGLGGFGQALAAAGPLRVTSFDPDRRLPALLGRRRDLDARPLPADGADEGGFDHAVIDGLGHIAGNILPLIPPAAALLGAGGALLLRTYVRVRGARHDRRRQPRFDQRSLIPAIDEIRIALDQAGFAVRQEQSCADMHAAAIEAAWRNAVDLVRVVHRTPDQRKLIPALLAAGEAWQQRVELIRGGAIDVRWILAVRDGAAACDGGNPIPL